MPGSFDTNFEELPPLPRRRSSADYDLDHIPDIKKSRRVVGDSLLGANLRSKGNLFHGLGILALVIDGPGMGVLIGEELGAEVGFVAGLVGGLFVTGFMLMIYRAVRNLRGEHD